MRDEVIREPTPEQSEVDTTNAGITNRLERKQPSLMSLIGLRQVNIFNVKCT